MDDNVEASYSDNNEAYFEKLNEPRIKYIKNSENFGAARSRNKAIFMSSGDYITFLDDDDHFAYDKIDLQLKSMVDNGYDASVCNLILVNDKGKVVDKRQRRYFNNKESLLNMHLKYPRSS